MKVILLCFLLFIVQVSNAQEVVSSAGGEMTSSQINLEYSLCEIATETFTTDSLRLTQGFEQPEITLTTVAENFRLNVSVFPNPTTNLVSFKTEDDQPVDRVEIFDPKGKHLFDKTRVREINLSPYSAGTYYLKLSDNDKINTYKIIKQ